MAFNDGMERRISLMLLQYWNELRDERPMPTEDELDPDRLTAIWQHCFLLQIRDIKHVIDYNYTYLGPALMQAYEDGTLDRFNGKMVAPDANRLASLYEQVIKTHDPLLDEGEYTMPGGRVIRFRQAMLPLGDTTGKVHSILGGAWFKVFSQ